MKILVWLCALLPLSLWGNALQITGLSVNQTAGTVTFQVSWQNSWRVSTVPFNWDGAWLFVKFRECGVAPTTAWTHGQLSTTLANHSFGAGIETILADGSGPGIQAAPNNLGVLIRPSAVGINPAFGPHTVTLRITNLPAAGTDIDVKVFGVEMVFVPQGNFTYGDGVSNFANAPVDVISEASLLLTNPAITLPATYPKGFNAFHCMKYEISQGQYVDFLNTLPSAAQTARYPSQTGNNRHEISNTGAPPDVYVTTRPNRACNYLDWDDVAAYLDWAALRPMTELEFEKACRGQAAFIAGEYAWGNTTVTASTTISTTIPSEDGSEIILNAGANANFGNTLYSGGDGGRGPLRVGIYALPTTSTRSAAGATYYGILDMSGNVTEAVVPASTNASSFTAVWGNGDLNGAGNHDAATWPAAGTYNTGANNNRFQGHRGGNYYDANIYLRISDRYFVFYNSWSGASNYSLGGRGVR